MDFKDIPGGAMEALEARVGIDIRGLSDIPARGNSKTIRCRPGWTRPRTPSNPVRIIDTSGGPK